MWRDRVEERETQRDRQRKTGEGSKESTTGADKRERNTERQTEKDGGRVEGVDNRS